MSTKKQELRPAEAQWLYNRYVELCKLQNKFQDKYDPDGNSVLQDIVATMEDALMDDCMHIAMRLDEAVYQEARVIPQVSWLHFFEGESYHS